VAAVLYDLERGANDDHAAQRELASHAIIATSRCEHSFVRLLVKLLANSSRASWRCSDEIGRR
jgi:hypothetical protein